MLQKYNIYRFFTVKDYCDIWITIMNNIDTKPFISIMYEYIVWDGKIDGYSFVLIVIVVIVWLTAWCVYFGYDSLPK